MEFCAKKFDELSVDELYEILRARSTVFIKGQGITCVDEDGVDRESLHCFFWEDGAVAAYLRAYRDSKDADAAHIGRVLAVRQRGGLGTQLMERSIPAIRNNISCTRIKADVQKHAVPFYEKLGFKVVSDEYPEEGIMHVDMEIRL
ncbi:MAG: GNAT family N-acetyltransferase [Lachnospiraceae bacterium]|nr:GNAT family N-acetyltransferase [Lachnospiraceae bacterium]